MHRNEQRYAFESLSVRQSKSKSTKPYQIVFVVFGTQFVACRFYKTIGLFWFSVYHTSRVFKSDGQPLIDVSVCV